MARTDDLPTAWPEFRQLTAHRPLGELAPWSRFADRYRLAHGFLGVRHRDSAFANTLDAEGHDALLGVALAGAAMESLELATGAASDGQTTTTLVSADLRDQWLGRDLRRLRFGVHDFLNEESRQRLHDMEASGDDDLRPVLDAFRELTLRGGATPAALQLDPDGIDFLNMLRVLVLGVLDAEFSAWVRQLTSR